MIRQSNGIRHILDFKLRFKSASKEVFEYFRPSTIIKTLHHPFNKSLDSIKIHRPNIRQTLSDVLAYLIIVTDATDAVSVNFLGRCKFLQI